ncbi:putative nuclear import and export protein Msn5 [Penicillium brasilianum]|uniref:Putative nuclear import and export protein Msn5 n=1 Tax=Penicillium brasilianum TaxID=104259 RepID=A0A1S9R8E6_PENBI|nr:putative nuclear import and export protein Msn5 [Penicillium brasilianum]
MAAEELSEAGMADIIRALEVIHSPTSTNALRKEALSFVEALKDNEAAGRNGFLLASRADHAAVVRYFGLTLLDHVLRHLSFTSPEESTNLRSMILQLAENIRPEDPSFFRNKIPQLWSEAAKKSWGLDWADMDEALVKFWGVSLVHNELVLSVLETLSEDVFFREDTVSSLRGSELNRALVEIFTPAAIVEQINPDKSTNAVLRCGQEGWLVRICEFLDNCVQNVSTSREARDAAVKALATLRSALSWSIYKAVIAGQVVASVFRALTCQDEQVLLAAVEALHSLYGRNNMGNDESHGLVCLIFESDYLNTLQNLYQWSIVGPEDADEPKYLISKRLSEMISYVAGCLEDERFLRDTMHRLDLPPFFNFMLNIMQHQSLTVSIPCLHLWSRLLGVQKIGTSEFVVNQTPTFLTVCTQRLIRWESLPTESEDPTIQFLAEDIDTIPERHAFLGNYRRYCSSIIETITQKRAQEAVREILGRVDENLDNLYSGAEPFQMHSYSKSSIPLMRADAQFAVVEAVIKGFNKWIEAHGKAPQQDEQERKELELAVESWASKLMQRNFEDPVIKQKVIKLVVDISSKALDNHPAYALKVLEHILMTRLPDQPEYPVYAEAVKELHGLASHELRRLAIRYADYFSTFYDLLEPKIREITMVNRVDDKLQMELTSILLIIMQRASNIDPNLRHSRLAGFLAPIREAWQDDEFRRMSSSFEGFCTMLGLENVGSYMQAKQAHKLEDWSSVALDNEGKLVQEEMTRKFQMLPLRGTKTMLAVSTDKLKRTSPAYQVACDMWQELTPQILPTLVQLLTHAHAFHNPANWAVSDDMRAVVERILTDRFWQAGISSGSRDDFYAKITASKSTLEGFASSVRGKIRAVRESCYSMLFSMSRMRHQFYGFAELPGPLSEALFKDAEHLSSHQFSVLLNISRCLIDDCPVQYRAQFLPPMLATLFRSIDRKITTEWELIEQRKSGGLDGDLTDEMKSESVLRQLTYAAVIMVASLFDPQRGDPDRTDADPSAPQPTPELADSIRHFVLSSPEIFEPVMLFCTHALRMRDTRCCSIITRVVRSILADFAPPNNSQTIVTIREFICTDVLQACITSVHESYFVDMQKDLAQLIASIWVLYGVCSETPRSVFLSLPGITPEKVAQTETALQRCTSPRQQRALVLELLEPLRGISIAEQGKILGSREERRKARTAIQSRYMTNEMETRQETHRVDINDGPDLSGVADMFA